MSDYANLIAILRGPESPYHARDAANVIESDYIERVRQYAIETLGLEF